MNDTKKLKAQIEKLTKINKSLMGRVERSMDQQGNAYSLFTTAIGLEVQNRARTDELKSALESLERSNAALVEARDTAEQAVKMKTRFFTAVGHDVLQPLHAARLSLSALGESDKISEHKKLAGQIDHALYSIEDLLRTIIDISKLETGTTQPAPASIRLDDVFNALALDFKPLISQKGLAFSSEVPPGIGIYTDPLMLRRILQNLLANAVRYTSSGQISLSAETLNSKVKISVSDTGPGICESEQKQIFDEFQRGEAASEAKSVGFGLGLSIVQRMAHALRHPIELKSLMGRGTVFSITVPLSTVEAARIETQQRKAVTDVHYGFGGANILLVENDDQVVDAMLLVLKQWSCQTHALKSIRQVKDYLSSNPTKPDIVLADFHLDHDECGLACVALVRDAFGADLPGLVITADHGRSISEAVYAAQCELLHKPVRPGELRALIKHLLN
ncbi:MAG: ATP-binding response regulator [Hyphomicrobiaceae bacterium]